jgi:ubiquinone/menaquinone biosynthesis C-methylase UbiE
VIDPARSFDRAAAEYEAARPEYPASLLDLLPIERHATVLDLGAGTGKLTRLLARRYRDVVAVEPLDGMRAILETIVPEARSLAGSAEAIPLADASVDAVFAAQAFHWFATDDAVTEIARVLRSGGVLCLIRNENTEPSPLPADYRTYLHALLAPSVTAVRAAAPAAEVLARGPFGELRREAVTHEQVQDREGVLAFAQSVSAVAHLPEAERAKIAHDLDSMLPPGRFAFPMTAEVTWTVRQ